MASERKVSSPTKAAIKSVFKRFGKPPSNADDDDGETFDVLFGDSSETCASSNPPSSVWTSAHSTPSIDKPTSFVQPSSNCGSSIYKEPGLEKTASRCISIELPPHEISTLDKDTTLDRYQSCGRRKSFDREPPSNVIDALNRHVFELTRRLEKVIEDGIVKADVRLRMLEARTATLEETFVMELRLKALEEQSAFVPETSSQSPANRRESSLTMEKRLAFLEACYHDLRRGSPWNRSLETVTDLIAEIAAKQCKIEESLFVLNSNGRLSDIRSTRMKDDTAGEHSERYKICCPLGPATIAQEMRIPARQTSVVVEAMGNSEAFSSCEGTVESSVLNEDMESAWCAESFDVDQLYLSTYAVSPLEELFRV